MPKMGFREQGIEPADGFTADGFIVRPLVPSDVALDYEAVMSSREFSLRLGAGPAESAGGLLG